MHLCDVWACRSNLCELESTSWTLLRVIFVKAQVSRTHLFTIHLLNVAGVLYQVLES